ncbi:uncharacterized protein LOC121052398 [Rosa chinensis]|uniref:uncharacterized protein LOC121052398 n=1 Tax=Rosa chinensis TaxID=74649 RepID=UPI001AD93B81|nr:uncharacterized protein LOC121052398 [Rosa chinensis]
MVVRIEIIRMAVVGVVRVPVSGGVVDFHGVSGRGVDSSGRGLKLFGWKEAHAWQRVLEWWGAGAVIGGSYSGDWLGFSTKWRVRQKGCWDCDLVAWAAGVGCHGGALSARWQEQLHLRFLGWAYSFCTQAWVCMWAYVFGFHFLILIVFFC